MKLLILFFSLLSHFTFAQKYDFMVSKDGSGDFSSVQEAIDAVPHLRKSRTTIFIKEGVYKEKLILPSTKTNVSFIGQNASKTILTFDDYASKLNVFGEEIGTSGSSSFFVYGNGFEAYNITFQNSSGPVGQAVAVRVDGDRVKFEDCRFLGYQDTLYTHGNESRQYYKRCYIEGSVDFIFGSSTAYFEDCEINCLNSGYITAASTPKENKYGYVFKGCKITGGTQPNTFFLGRPWRPFAHVVFVDCDMGDVINPEGWDSWGSEEKKKTVFYAEYQSKGVGAEPMKRVSWSHQLKVDEVDDYSLEAIFGDWLPNKIN